MFFSHYSSFIPLVLVLFVWGTFVTLCVTVTNIFLYFFTHTVSIRQNKIYSFVQSAEIKTANICTIPLPPKIAKY